MDTALVLSASRRYLYLLGQDGSEFRAMAGTKSIEATVGDSVVYKKDKDGILVTDILPRKNFLARTIGKATKRIASNLDRLYIVTAVVPLFNTHFIDRISVTAFHESIPCTLLLNKIDLGVDDTEEYLAAYERMNIDNLRLSAKSGNGIDALKEQLENPELKIVALSGISGVGKSTILNALLPGVEIRTQEVSDKTGQGRQTTSQSHAYRYPRKDAGELLIVDLPGVQNFGLGHLSTKEIISAMPDIFELSHNCEYHDCKHIAEPNCAVKSALEAGTLAFSRYDSYLNMLEELESCKPY